MKHPIEFFSFEETFGEVSDGQLVSAGDVEKAQRAFDEFLAGERSTGNVERTLYNMDGSLSYQRFEDRVARVRRGRQYYE